MGKIQVLFPQGYDPARGSDHEGVVNLVGRPGLGHGVSEISRVGSDRVG